LDAVLANQLEGSVDGIGEEVEGLFDVDGLRSHNKVTIISLFGSRHDDLPGGAFEAVGVKGVGKVIDGGIGVIARIEAIEGSAGHTVGDRLRSSDREPSRGDIDVGGDALVIDHADGAAG
jgi:hypothetical protein